MYPLMSKAAEDELRRAVRQGFEYTQELIHVDTGRCKASGRILEHGTGGGYEFDVTYGGDEYGVDYAGWLELFYPYLEPGMQRGLATFGDGPDLLVGPFG